MEGATCLAFLNISRTAFSDSPTHFDKSSGPLTLMKFAELSFATAFARRVFPVPGGPYKRIPFGGFIPILSNFSGLLRGHSTASLISCLASSSPPTSSQFTRGISTITSLIAEGSTSFNASSKSLPVTRMLSRSSRGTASSFISGRYLRRAFMAASFASAEMSAPTKPCVLSEMYSSPTSAERGIPRVWIWRISILSSLSGTPISISLSNLPGLRNAGSMASILFVAPITTTCPLSSKPSIIVRSWATTLLSTSPVTSSLFGAILSNSSMNIMEGELLFACSNISRNLCSLSP